MQESLKQKTFRGTVWSALEAVSIQLIQFVVMLIMARLLMPADYGVIGMLAVFMAISGSLINCNFGTALIRKQDRTEVDNSTVFFFNIVMSIIFYWILFFSAPYIADFYGMPILIPVTRVIGIKLVIDSFRTIQTVNYTQKLNFKTQAKASVTASVISGVIGIILAYYKFGVWALVWQQISSGLLGTFLLWYNSPWRPFWAYSWKSFRELFGFGSKLMLSGLINTAYSNIYQISIGKVYKAADLGFYTRAVGFTSLATTSLMSIIQRVSYPVLCTIQNDDARLIEGYRRILKMAVFLTFPMLLGMAAVAKPMVVTLIGEKWLFSAQLLLPICLASMWYPVHSINLNLLQVKGRSDLFLKLEIIKKVIGVGILVASIPFGVYWMCWGSLLGSLIALFINTFYTQKLMNFGILKQFKDFMPTLLLSATMGVIVWLTLQVLPFSSPALLAIGVIEGTLIYIAGIKIFHFPELDEIRSLLKRTKTPQMVASEV